MSKVLKDLGPNEVVILITGTGERMTNILEMTREVEARRLPVYIISYPPTLDTSYTRLARWGGVYSVVENSHNIQPLIHLQVERERVMNRIIAQHKQLLFFRKSLQAL